MIRSEIVYELEQAVGSKNVITDRNELIAYSYDGQPEKRMPDAMVLVSQTREIAEVVAIAVRYNIPLIARGAGSGLTGGAVPEHGGIVLNFERMNRILRIDSEDRIGYVQPGVITADFQKEAAGKGLFYPPEPASAQHSTIGGNVAESAGGLTCVKYGLTKQFVAGLEFVSSEGEIVRTGVYSDREAPFDIGALMVGSEGTLGIVTEVALRLIPLPTGKRTILALFRTLIETVRASNAVLSCGVEPAVLEFMDRSCIDAVRDYAGVDIPEETAALLLIELDGDDEYLAAAEAKVMSLLKSRHPVELKSAQNADERNALWKLRKSTSPAIALIGPLKFNEDICVPLSRIPEMCAFVEELGKRHNVRVVSFGHSGDGNLHINFMTDRKRPQEVARVKLAIEELFREAVRVGGTLSGEHGIGMMKRPYLKIALNKATIEFEKKVKQALDPSNVFNPGKIFPE
ncbi:MAG: FAD-linked oxidase C-terminal domain-containing protein [Candidatus Latescibacterota bacterium]